MKATAPASRGASPAAWTVMAIVVAVSLLSTFTLSTNNDGNATNVAAGGTSDDSGFADEEFDDSGLAVLGADTGGDVSGAGGTGGRRTRRTSTGTGDAGTGTGTGPDAGTGTGTGPDGGGGGGGGSTGGGDCSKDQNAGATDTGVTGSTINFAATIVKTGIAKDFLADAQAGMEAVIRKTNKKGICGRLIKVKYDDDSWDPSIGQKIIEKYIAAKAYFGLAVNPSSEGLRFPIESGIIKSNKFPVIGADGMLKGQYQDPWVWPVATSTHSVMHIMAKDAYNRGARKFGIVWENTYRFGVEGHDAFIGQVKRLAGANAVVSDKPIQGGKTSYKTEANEFVTKCSTSGQDLKKCDFIAVLLEPATASQWVRDGGMGNGTDRPAKGFGGPQPLFVNSFARDCGKFCANIYVWTSFKPPTTEFETEPAVATYLSDLRAVSQTADANNPHVEGAYVGMLLVVDVLKKMGAAPTRVKAKELLDQTTLDTGLTKPLRFTADNHFSSICARSFEAIYNVNNFVNWRKVSADCIDDADVSKDL